MLIRGEAKVYRTINQEGDKKINSFIKTLTPGTVFGEFSFFTERDSEFSVVSTSYTTCYKLVYS